MRSQRMAIGDNYIDHDNYTWEESDGDGGEIDYAADLVVEGNVGIGTTNPSNTLAIETGAGLAGKGIVLTDGGQTYAQLIDVSSASDSGTLELFYDGTKTIYISAADGNGAYFNSGNVGIGTTSPASILDVFNSTAATFRVGVDSTHRFLVSAGPGTTTVSSGKNQIEFTTTDTNIYFTAGGAGGLYLATGGTSWTGNSDMRLKKNITTISNALERVSKIRGVNFNWASASSSPDLQIGVIAQEVQVEFPELISTDKNGYLGIQYDKLGPILIEAIKEQQSQIDTLKQEISQLKASKS